MNHFYLTKFLHRLTVGLVGLVLLALTACGDEREIPVVIAIEVFPAQLDGNPAEPPPPGWQRVAFPGSQRSTAGSFLVAEQTILTGWSITALRVAEEPDGSRAVNARLNAAAIKRLAEFCADAGNLKLPLGLRINGRWADFSPLLRAPGDRLSLYGFTPEEATRLESWLQVR